jgi:hypothetical protein
MELPDTAPSFGPFQASALAIAKFAPTAQASCQQVLKLTGRQIEAGVAEADAASAVDTFKRRFLGVGDANQAVDPVEQTALAAPWPLAGAVFFIKQTRSAQDSTSASYQELLKGSLSLTNISEPAILAGTWTLELNDYDSYPFIRGLGLGTPTNGKLAINTDLALYAKIDFTVDLATAMT